MPARRGGPGLGTQLGASMPPLFDGASGRAASDGRCAPALPAALDHFHANLGPATLPPPQRCPPNSAPGPGEGAAGSRGGVERGVGGRVGTRRQWRRWRALQRWSAGTEMRGWGAHGAGGGFVSPQLTVPDRPLPPVPAAPSFWGCPLCHPPHVPVATSPTWGARVPKPSGVWQCPHLCLCPCLTLGPH